MPATLSGRDAGGESNSHGCEMFFEYLSKDYEDEAALRVVKSDLQRERIVQSTLSLSIQKDFLQL